MNCKFGHQVVPLALVSILATRWRHLHCYIAWDCPLTSSVGIELLSSSARVTSVKSAKPLVVTDGHRPRPIDRTPGTPGSDKNQGVLANVSEMQWDVLLGKVVIRRWYVQPGTQFPDQRPFPGTKRSNTRIPMCTQHMHTFTTMHTETQTHTCTFSHKQTRTQINTDNMLGIKATIACLAVGIWEPILRRDSVKHCSSILQFHKQHKKNSTKEK